MKETIKKLLGNVFKTSSKLTMNIAAVNKDKIWASLTPRQMKILLCIAKIVSDDVTDEKYKPFETLNIKIYVDRSCFTSSNWPAINISLSYMARMLNGERRIGGKDVEKLREQLENLEKIKFVTEYSNGKRTVRVEERLFGITKQISVLNNGETKWVYCGMYVNPIFVYELNDKFAQVPHDIFTRFNYAESNNRMFYVLFFLLIEKRGHVMKHSDDCAYAETKRSILSRVGENYYRNINGGGQRKKRLQTDMDKAVNSLKTIGLITDYREETNNAGETKCVFLLNPDFTKPQSSGET